MDVFLKIKDLLDSRNIDYKVLTHEPVFTSEQAAKVRGVDIKQGAKAMVVRSKGEFSMLVISAAKRIGFKKVKEIFGTKSVSFATPEEVEKITGCKIGSVPPYGNLFNIPVYVDKSLLENEIIDFNAGKHDASIQMKCKDYIDIVEPVICDFSEN